MVNQQTEKLFNSSGEKVDDYSDYTVNNTKYIILIRQKILIVFRVMKFKIQKELKKSEFIKVMWMGKVVLRRKSINLWLQELELPDDYISKDIVGKIIFMVSTIRKSITALLETNGTFSGYATPSEGY